MLGVADPEVDLARPASRVHTQDVEHVIRNPALRGIGWLSRCQLQGDVIVMKFARVEKLERLRD
jgi:hypothetical protein